MKVTATFKRVRVPTTKYYHETYDCILFSYSMVTIRKQDVYYYNASVLKTSKVNLRESITTYNLNLKSLNVHKLMCYFYCLWEYKTGV